MGSTRELAVPGQGADAMRLRSRVRHGHIAPVDVAPCPAVPGCTRRRMRVLAAAVATVVAVVAIAVAPAAVVAQVPNAAAEDGDHLDHTVDHEYNVEFEDNGPLGLELDERLRVTAFRRGKGGVMGAAEATGWISVGDRLVSVNERPLEGVSLRDAVMHIHRASTPRILRFHTRAHTDRIVQMQREKLVERTKLCQTAGGACNILLPQSCLQLG